MAALAMREEQEEVLVGEEEVVPLAGGVVVEVLLEVVGGCKSQREWREGPRARVPVHGPTPPQPRRSRYARQAPTMALCPARPGVERGDISPTAHAAHVRPNLLRKTHPLTSQTDTCTKGPNMGLPRKI